MKIKEIHYNKGSLLKFVNACEIDETIYEVSWDSGENGSSMPYIKKIATKEEECPTDKCGCASYTWVTTGKCEHDSNALFGCCHKEEPKCDKPKECIHIDGDEYVHIDHVVEKINEAIEIIDRKRGIPSLYMLVDAPKKEFTYEPLISTQTWTQGSIAGRAIIRNVYAINVCDKVFDIKSGMSGAAVIGIAREIERHVEKYIKLIIPATVISWDGSSRIKIINENITTTIYHIKDNMEPKAIQDVMMKVCERIEKFIKEGK